MAKRKLLNRERDIILSKCLNKTFHPALQKIDKEYAVINKLIHQHFIEG